jgi:hypothetical protein
MTFSSGARLCSPALALHVRELQEQLKKRTKLAFHVFISFRTLFHWLSALSLSLLVGHLGAPTNENPKSPTAPGSTC